jgi:predicted MFS family arabinose efflux permease
MTPTPLQPESTAVPSETKPETSPPATSAIPHAPLPFLGLACAVGVSSIYYNQPLLLEMSRTFHTTVGQAGFVAVATQVGYASGLLFCVPLGDVLERRSLIVRMYAGVATALLLVAVAQSMGMLIAASVMMGLFCSVTHIVLPIAPDLADDASRGRAIGIVMTGLLLGILLARTFSGWVSDLGGWRSVFVIAAVVNLAFAPMFHRFMPKLPPKQDLSYAGAMRSLWTIFRAQPLLRESCVMGALIFASFSCFWTTLAFLLDSHYGLGAGIAGSFGVVGAAGALVAPVAGRLSDKRGPRWVISVGVAILASSYVWLWAEEKAPLPFAVHIAALAIGVVVLDVGSQMIQVANQTRIFGLDPSARSRLNTVYMTIYFSGAAAGSALATVAWVRWQWDGVCGLAITCIALASLRHITGRRGGPEAARPTGEQGIESACLEA